MKATVGPDEFGLEQKELEYNTDSIVRMMGRYRSELVMSATSERD